MNNYILTQPEINTFILVIVTYIYFFYFISFSFLNFLFIFLWFLNFYLFFFLLFFFLALNILKKYTYITFVREKRIN